VNIHDSVVSQDGALKATLAAFDPRSGQGRLKIEELKAERGINTNYSYDSLSHLLSVLHQAGVNTLDGASYTYDPAGNRLSNGNYLNGITSNYAYDPLYELTQVTKEGARRRAIATMRWEIDCHHPVCRTITTTCRTS
jgi:hypothetical protein